MPRYNKHYFFLLILVFLLQGCVSVPKRNPLPKELSDQAQIPGIPWSKIWADDPQEAYSEEWFALSREEIISKFPAIFGKPHKYLAISGGGAKGAFGAGFLAGWSASGTRPEFSMVTGISTGALIAPFAYLGPDYDDEIKEMYTQYSTKDLIKHRNILSAIMSDATASTKPLRELIKKYYNETIVDAIARESKRGRVLEIATTNLDAQRPVIWSIGRIAASSHPQKVELIQKIILASASIPVAFEPVLIEVEAGGQTYDELHVDGGASAQVFLYPTDIDWERVLKKLEVKEKPEVYVIRNAHVDSQFNFVNNRLLPIAESTIESLIRTQGIGDLYRIYLSTQRDGLNFNLTYIPKEFDEISNEMFDPIYMRKLYQLGFEMGQRESSWHHTPPGFEE